MEPISLGYRTDLMVLGLQGAEVADRGDHLVVRVPAQPEFYWGNFLLYAEPPGPGDLERWKAAFRAEFPEARHMTFGVDTTDGAAGDAAAYADAGLTLDLGVVLSTEAPHESPRPNREARLRMLESDGDWARAAELSLAGDDAAARADEGHRAFLERRLAALRAVTEAGHGAWFGAFLDGEMVSELGVFTDGAGIARYQSVDTHPAFRGRGLAGTLVHHAGRYALAELGARRLVIAADVDSQAARIYRSVGFAGSEMQVAALAFPDRPAPS